MPSDVVAAGAVANSLPFSYARRHNVFIGEMPEQGQPTVFYRDRLAPEVIAELMRLFDAAFEVKQLPAEQFDQGLAQAYQRDSSTAMQMVEEMGDELDLVRLADVVSQTEDLLEQEDDAPIIRLINALLTEAIKHNASDIHIETYERRLLVRFRIDGVLREMVQPRRELAPLLVSRIKVMARLDIAEKRVPQDGRISLKLGGREVDVRVSTLPANNGERVVMRLLDKQAGRLNLLRLGMPTDLHNNFSQLLHRPHGIFLVTGPTGSGKTTTLYAGLGEINDHTRNILTVEDPIEYNLEGIGQTQVNIKADMTFARGLRAMLRQDPDVVMVGEIRDRETAEIAVQASLTGHLVLSTLHTNTAVGAITRLRDMGIEPFLLASSLLGILAQRLVRVLCPECKTEYRPAPRERELLELADDADVHLFHATGCAQCNESGYKGRTGIYELLPISEAVRQLIHNEATEEAILQVVRPQFSAIRQDGRRCVLAGITTLEEVLRVTQEEG